MLIPPAYAAAGPSGTTSMLVQFAPLVLIFVVFYFLLIRPQQQQRKQTDKMRAALKRGDKVVTGGGILGVVQKARDGVAEIEVEIATGVRVTVLRETISSVMTAKPANDPKPAEGAKAS